jgi:hypothetical protein
MSPTSNKKTKNACELLLQVVSARDDGACFDMPEGHSRRAVAEPIFLTGLREMPGSRPHSKANKG